MRDLIDFVCNLLEGITVGGESRRAKFGPSSGTRFTLFPYPLPKIENSIAILTSNSVKWRPTYRTRAVPAGEPAARAPLVERMSALRAQGRALSVAELRRAYHALVHGRAK